MSGDRAAARLSMVNLAESQVQPRGGWNVKAIQRFVSEARHPTEQMPAPQAIAGGVAFNSLAVRSQRYRADRIPGLPDSQIDLAPSSDLAGASIPSQIVFQVC